MNSYDSIKNKLNKVSYYKREMQRFDDLMAALISNATRVTPAYSLAPAGGSQRDKMADFASELEELETKRAETTKLYLKEILNVISLIDKLESDVHVTVLRQRYLGGYRWSDIAIGLSYTERRVHQLHHEAIVMLTKNIS